MSEHVPLCRQLAQAQRRIGKLEEAIGRHSEVVAAARDLGEADEEATNLLRQLFSGHCGERVEVRHEVIDRLAAAERQMRRVAKEMEGAALHGPRRVDPSCAGFDQTKGPLGK